MAEDPPGQTVRALHQVGLKADAERVLDLVA